MHRILVTLTLFAKVRPECRTHANGRTNCIYDENGGYTTISDLMEEYYNDHANEEDVDPSMRVIIRRKGMGGTPKSDHPQHPQMSTFLRHKFCQECYPTPNATADDISTTNHRSCPIDLTYTMKFGLRNYGCNCFSDNGDTLYTSATNAYYGTPDWSHGNNGKPVDDVDNACHRQHLRTQCVEQDVRDGIFPELVGEGRDGWSWYRQHMQLCDPNFRKPTFDGKSRLVSDNCTAHTVHGIDPWLINTFKVGKTLHVPHFVDIYGQVFCGNETNPDYENGIPPGEEPLAAVCFNYKQWAQEVFDGMGGCAQTPREYFEDNLEKYFTYTGVMDFSHQNRSKIFFGELNSVMNISSQLDGSAPWRMYDANRVDFTHMNCGTGRKQLDCTSGFFGNQWSDNRTDAIGSIMRGIDSLHDEAYQNSTKYNMEYMLYGFSERAGLCWDLHEVTTDSKGNELRVAKCDGQWGRHSFDLGKDLVPEGKWNGQVYPIVDDHLDFNLTNAQGFTYPKDENHPNIRYSYVFNNWRKVYSLDAIDVHDIVETSHHVVSHWEKPYSTAPQECARPPAPVGERVMQCCGEYPHRYPMNQLTHICCNGVVKEIGDGCDFP